MCKETDKNQLHKNSYNSKAPKRNYLSRMIMIGRENNLNLIKGKGEEFTRISDTIDRSRYKIFV